MDSEAIEQALGAIDVSELATKPRIVKLDWDSFLDSSGEETLEVFVVLDDATTDEEIENAPIDSIQQSIVDKLAESGISSSPYFVFEYEREHESPERCEL